MGTLSTGHRLRLTTIGRHQCRQGMETPGSSRKMEEGGHMGSVTGRWTSAGEKPEGAVNRGWEGQDVKTIWGTIKCGCLAGV